ncbi:MAG TPA: alpha/beta-hydrolase family protein [Streptosporangiaceae bacterium]|nr:alpha/beta-hydrolase family protein [Streptosporangiaceae bacterium]
MDLETVARRAGDLLAGGDTAERAAVLASTATAGTSFGPGLLPRPGLDQALATGIVAAANHGLVMTSQSACAALARRLVPDDGTPPGRVRAYAAQVAVSGGVAVAGAVLERLLPWRPGEPMRRAALRTAGRRGVRVGLAGAALAGVAAADAAVGGRRPGLRVLAAGGGLLAGTALAGWQIYRYRIGEEEDPARLGPAVDPLTGQRTGGETAPEQIPLPPVARSLLMGAAVSTGLHGIAFAERALSHGLAAGIRRAVPGARPVAGLVGHTAALGMTVAGLGAAMEYLDRRAETGGSAIDAAYTTPPDVETVSGSPASAVAWPSLGREGVRFVNLALTRQEIADVTGVPIGQVKTPVRAFAGLASGETVDVRVDLVMEDLARLGAFERSVLCVASPTGSGYVNYVAAETLEYLTRGDCATVALQYSLRPSFLSLDRVAMGREQNRALLHALEWRLRALPEGSRPRLVGFGESLGAHTMQDAFLHEGVPGLHRVGMDRALFLGTPAGSKWARQWRLDPGKSDPDGEVAEVASYAEWLALPAEDRARRRYVLLSHHEDPITRFEPALIVQQPGWLGPAASRPPGISHLAGWYPLTTFVLTLVDVKNAMSVTPGTFFARGHDYRADLARMVSEAYGLPVTDAELLAIEQALRRREATWAQRRVVAEQLRRAREAVQRQTKTWSLAPDAVAAEPGTA